MGQGPQRNAGKNVSKLSILLWNVTGLKGKFYGYTHSSKLFTSYLENFEIIGLTETWAKDGDSFDIAGYNCFSATRPKTRVRGRCSGGIAVYIREDLYKFTKRLNSVSHNILWIWIEAMKLGLNQNFLIGITYISPENSSVYNEEDTFAILESEILELRDKFFNTKVILAGDFNSYTGTEPDLILESDKIFDHFHADGNTQMLPQRANRDTRKVNKFGRKLLDLCIMTGMYILNGRLGQDKEGEHTCIFGENPSLIDYFLSDADFMSTFSDLKVDYRYESHHLPVWLRLKINVYKQDKTTNALEAKFLPRYLWNDQHASMFLDSFCAKDLSAVTENLAQNKIDEALFVFTDGMRQAAVNLCCNRVRKVNESESVNKRTQERWFDGECKSARINTIKQLKLFRKHRNTHNLLLFKEMKDKLNKLYAIKKKIFNDHEKAAVLDSIENKDNIVFWSTVKKYTKRKQFNNATISDDAWLTHFRDLYNPGTQQNSRFALNTNYYMHDFFLDRDITEDEVLNAVKRLKSGKSPGEDGFEPAFYKGIFPIAKEHILNLFNCIYNLGYFPKMWSSSLIVPIHKKGSYADPNNYRGISLLPVFSKVFMNVMYYRLNKWCCDHAVLCQEQGGFKQGFGTIDSIFTLNTIISKYTQKKGGRFYCAFVDFTKAFDLLNRNALWLKLEKLKVSSKMINMLKGVYKQVSAKILTKSSFTESFEYKWGVKQGCILSPTLFNMFIDDLSTFFKDKGTFQIPLKDHEVSLLLYADDLVLLSDSAIGLQRQLNWLQEYCELWNLRVSKEKSKIMVFRNGGRLRNYEKWFYNGSRLETCTYFTYLGVSFSSALSWSHNIKVRAAKGLRALGSIRTLMYKIPDMNSKVLWKIFDTKIKPILHYGAEIWGYNDANEIERVQNKMCKLILKINSRIPAIAARGELGRFPLKNNRLHLVLNYWLKLVSMSNERLTKDAYKLQLDWSDRNKKCWAYDVKYILHSYGFGEVWLNQGVTDRKMFLNLFKQRIHDTALQSWKSDVNEMDRLKLYRVFKRNLENEEYIDKLGSYNKCLIANFRCTGLPLKTVTGVYYEKIDYNLCYCDFCKLPLVENEFHFLLVCGAYNEMRKKFIPAFYWNPPSIFKFEQLMSRNDLLWLNKLSAFLKEAMNERSRLSILHQ